MVNTFNLGASSNTFTQESSMNTPEAAGDDRLYSAVFALNLDKFDVQTAVYTEGESAALSGTDYATEVQTTSIQPTVTGDVWILGGYVTDASVLTEGVKMRVQADNANVLVEPDEDFLAWAGQSTERNYNYDSTIENLNTTSHPLDLDASRGATSGPVAESRLLMAVTMELSATDIDRWVMLIRETVAGQ